MHSGDERFWRRQARRTAIRHNLGWWLGAFLPAAIAVSVVFAGVLLFLRKSGTVPSDVWLWYAGSLGGAAGFALLRARRRFFSVADGMVRLDVHLGLHNRLTAAAAGVGVFPPPTSARDGLAWRWEKIAAPVAASALLVCSAAVVPVSLRAGGLTPTDQPVAWTQLESWIEKLEEKNAVQPPSIDALREKLQELQNQPAREWYSHSSLEAGDSLRQQTAQSLQALQRDLQSAAAALAAIEQMGDQTSDAALKNAQSALAKALQGLELGTLPLNKELLAQLKDLDLSKLKQLSPEQLAALKERLKESKGACAECIGLGESNDEANALVAVLAPHGGGIQRGPGTLPLGLNEKPTELNTSGRESISNDDLSRALPGDVLGVGQGEHKIDKTLVTGPSAGGELHSAGEGGEAVWRNDVTPREREILKRFFK